MIEVPRFNWPSVIVPLLRSRPATLGVLLLGAMQIGLMIARLPGWQCPVRALLQVPCPGCGLTRGVVSFFQGDWNAGLQYHLFAPIAILFLLILVSSGLLPARPRLKIISGIEILERRFGLTVLLLVALFAYWLLRLLFWRESFFRLVLSASP